MGRLRWTFRHSVPWAEASVARLSCHDIIIGNADAEAVASEDAVPSAIGMLFLGTA